ncbi:sporulation protein YqfD [Neobacillus thermocopriae]|uniref:sporulation protein YqfD n=1 Tax=Neobacillus thermocopriae TaxID=1215031 RepID=UPI002E22D6A6|nr:sporulation protein YqfD [Neobacillus thermocopriae]MED3624817.1 sporulation protein YqfD [Neobacillus thermocopriae]MED3715511.1 sporulation protein YqfD [Neobacillus thermocopriae]
MKNQWIDFLFGMVTVKITGKGIERFINVLTRNEIIIWNVKRHGTETITFQMKLEDAKNIRYFARHTDCQITFLKRKGVPFLFRRLLKNSGFLTGAVIFLLIIFLLSNVIWGIEIKGAKPDTEYQIRKELDRMGVKIGKLQFFVKNVEGIQRELTNNVGNLTWVGVELKGTTYHLQVVEKNEPEKQKELSPQNLVAKKKAIIVKTFVEEGKKVVDIHDYVQKGQLLVSGEIGQDGENVKLVPAKGKVWGETWYKSHVEQPLDTKFKVLNGNEKQRHALAFGKFELPIWGFKDPEYKQFETEKTIYKLHFLKWVLPVSYIQTTIRESEDIIRSYTKEQAEQIALERAKKEIKSRLDEDAMFKDEKILHKEVKNGKVILDIHFKMIENIAVEQPISKETRE